MSIWASMPRDMRAYNDEYPDREPQLHVDVASSGISPLIRLAVWTRKGHFGTSGEFYMSREDAERMIEALREAVDYSRSFDEDGAS